MATMETVIYPKTQTVTVKTFEDLPGDFESYREIIGVRILTFVRLYDNGDGVYVDDEALWADSQYFWMHKNYPQPLVNIGVFVGTDAEGETTPPNTTYNTLKNDIRFIGDRYDVALATRVNGHLIDTENGYEDYRPIFFR